MVWCAVIEKACVVFCVVWVVLGYARLRCHTRNLEVWLINYGCRASARAMRLCDVRCVVCMGNARAVINCLVNSEPDLGLFL